MFAARFLFSLILGLALAGAPVLQALGKSAMPAPEAAASEHAGHTGSAHHQHDASAGSCAQHVACDGQCCTSCAHSFTSPAILLLGDDRSRAVMTPAVQHLVFSSPVFLRERPPRMLSL